MRIASPWRTHTGNFQLNVVGQLFFWTILWLCWTFPSGQAELWKLFFRKESREKGRYARVQLVLSTSDLPSYNRSTESSRVDFERRWCALFLFAQGHLQRMKTFPLRSEWNYYTSGFSQSRRDVEGVRGGVKGDETWAEITSWSFVMLCWSSELHRMGIRK